MTIANDPLGLVGTTVAEKYDVEKVVGEGGFATVYRAIHKLWKRPVAIKVFRAMSDLRADRREQLVGSFIQEGALLAELSERSAAICQARDVGTLHTGDGRDMPYMVLEWLEGLTLEQLLIVEKNQKLLPRTPAQALMLLEPAAVALALAHRKGIAHRDVKPSNIFVIGDARGDFTIKLLDFGIAKVVQDMQGMDGSFARTQGVVSSFTPGYGAPEQFSRTYGATGPWTDAFALALIYTELLTHAPALRGDDLTQLAFCSMDTARRPTPRAYGANVTDGIEEVLRRALAVSPDARFRSMGEFWNGLRIALGMDPIGGVAESQRNIPVVASGPTLLEAPNVNRGNTKPLGSSGGGDTTRSAPSVSPPAPTSGTAKLFAASAAGIIAVAAALAFGVWVFAIRGKDAVPPAGALPMAVSASAPVSSAAPVPKAELTCPTGMTKIPGGKFFMGSDDKTDLPDERPAHQVTLSPYCIDTFEVTVARYKECSDRGECKRAPRENEWPKITARERKTYDPLCNIRDPEGRAQYPINCIDWELASAFCVATGGRLPTEAEWEFATRGSDGRKYPWGDDPPNGGRLNACGKECLAWGKKNGEEVDAMYPSDDGHATTAPVGSFPKGASPFGLQDVVGNVWEWASDWYAAYGPDAKADPKGPSSGTERVMRGGSWNGADPAWVRPTFRFKAPPAFRSHGIGFRCVKELSGSGR